MPQYKPPMPNIIKYGFYAGGAFVALLIILLINPFTQIQSGYVGVKLNFGSIQPAPLEPGLHVVTPIMQSVQLVSVQPDTVNSDETASTHDLQNVTASVAVTFHIAPSDAVYFYQTFRSLDVVTARIINPNVSNDVKAVTANYDAEELVTKRDVVAAQIKDMVTSSLAPYHLTVEAVNVSNFAFSQAYSDAIEAKQVSQQQALQAQYTLQQTQISAQQQVVQAKAQADAAVATAQGDAQATMVRAQASAKANALLSQSLTPQILQQIALQRWNGTLPAYMSSGAALPLLGTLPTAGQSADK